jgi:hypothetical protein
VLKLLRLRNLASEDEYIFDLSGRESCINRMYSIITGTHLKYESSRKYRDCIMSGGDISFGKIKLLKGERMIVEEKEVWNVTNSPFIEGIMIITNVRVIWYLKGKEEVSLSIPYLCMQEIVEEELKEKKVVVIRLVIYRKVENSEGKLKRLRGFFSFSYSTSLPPLFFSSFFFSFIISFFYFYFSYYFSLYFIYLFIFYLINYIFFI